LGAEDLRDRMGEVMSRAPLDPARTQQPPINAHVKNF
jgi:hypothetical protein